MIDDSNFDKFEDQDKRRFLSELIIPEGIKILSNLFKVQSPGYLPKFNAQASGCSDRGYMTINAKYNERATYADFILFLGVRNEPSKNYLAYASYCALEQEKMRPVAGFIVWNEAKISFEDGNLMSQLDTFLHEAIHTLFFHPTLFKTFPENSLSQSFLFYDEPASTWKIRGDNVLNQAKTYFACPSLNGVALENGGDVTSAAAHFEKLLFADEIMTPDDTLETRLSAFTLAVAKDSGFLDIDMSQAEEVFWGKGEGCDFANMRCELKGSDEFCEKEGEVACSDNLMYRTKCHDSIFTGNCSINLNRMSCKVPRQSSNEFATYGQKSLCLSVIVGIFCLSNYIFLYFWIL